MHFRFRELLNECKELESQSDVKLSCAALWRILIQHVSISLVELVIHYRVRRNQAKILDGLPIAEIVQPSDGTTCRIIRQLIDFCETEYVPRISQEFYKVSQERTLECWQLLDRGQKHNADNLLLSLAARRNDDILGHGLPSEINTAAELSAIEYLFECFMRSGLVPSANPEDDSLYLTDKNGEHVVLRLLRSHDGHLSVYRRIKRLSAEKSKVEVQVERGLREKSKDSYTVEFPLDVSINASLNKRYSFSRAVDNWSPFLLVPERETETFTGRQAEIEEISEWLDDVDSRACLIYGDGGIGKTTFILEFVHRLLEGVITSTYKPEIITFFTAKRTRWGIRGLQIIDTRSPALDDVAHEILMALEGSLQKDWYVPSGKDLIEKLADFLSREYGINRKDHLLILDNTETFAASPSEVDRLSKELRVISQKLGRVIVTSRRREKFEARHIEMPPLSTAESIDLLRKRAAELDLKSVLQAGASTLNRIAKTCGCKPLILEVFIQAVRTSPSGSIDEGRARVVRMQREDLGEFLYSDAWDRLNIEMKHLLLLMTKIGQVHNDTSFNLCCDEVGISSMDANDALEESRGIARIIAFDRSTQISFTHQFMDFAKDRKIMIDGSEAPDPKIVQKVSKRFSVFLANSTVQVADRIQRAFRHPYAKAAYEAYMDDKYTECAEMYDLALLEDPDNPWLYDRYAYSLMMKLNNLKKAFEMTMRSTQLCDDDPDIWFTRGMIERKQRKMNDAFTSFTKAEALGKPKHLCHLQKSYAAMHSSPPLLPLARTELNKARRSAPSDDPYMLRFEDDLFYAECALEQLSDRRKKIGFDPMKSKS
ncbi:AAA family ATPase [Synechococcus sp. EJ6-Ellesmere]|uniref:AAA family ATPase n=1 Tax=Synechococcus sp. EJ6-Ellesmere TaxID=2823734 RepID=UPI0020CEEC9B|nr:AAA family ATPase [Synechococcus sp. EJ6-Ellesmere]MCP9824902.1 hypothetical protein [Synechococcus sp. EJ6-Ellesmere]